MILPLLKSYWRELTIAILAILLYFSATSQPDQSEEITRLTQIITKYRQKDTDTQKEITTVTKQPDGTIITKTEKVTKKTKENSGSTDKKEVVTTKIVTNKDKYRVSLYRQVDRESYSAAVGARLGNLPLSAEILGSDNGRSWSLGLGFSW